MKFLERDLEKIIWESDNVKLRKRGLNIYGKKLRQVRIGNYGIADIITLYRTIDQDGEPFLDITVYELKNENAGISAFLQALRYVKGIESYLKKYKPNLIFKLNIILCAKEIDTKSDYIYLTDFIFSEDYYSLCSVKNYSFNYSIDGINFKVERDYHLTNEGF